MPEINIDKGSNDRSELVFTLLPGEDKKDFKETNMTISLAMNYLRRFRELRKFQHNGDREKAENILTGIIPQDVAKALVKALLNSKTGTKLVLAMNGETEHDGFRVERVEYPEE